MGDDLKPFGVRYRFGGKQWMVTVHARDESEAMLKLRAAATNGEAGLIAMQVRSSLPPSIMFPLLAPIAWAVNAWASFKRWWRA